MESTKNAINHLQNYLELNWTKHCILSSAGDSGKFKITNAKLLFSIVTLSTKDNVYLTKQLRNRIKRSVYYYNYQAITAKVINDDINIYELLSVSF